MGLTNFFIYVSKCCFGVSHEQTSNFGFLLAKSLAMVSPSLENTKNAMTVGPLPGLMYEAASVAAKVLGDA